MAFSNPIIGGDDTLVRNAIQSEGFVSGSTGWRVERTGDAEFNSVVVRGELDVIGTDGSYVRAMTQTGHADVLLRPEDRTGYAWEPGTLRADIAPTTDNPQISLIGPSNQGSVASPAKILIQGPGDPDASQIVMSSEDGIQLDLSSDVNLLNAGTWIRRGRPTALSLLAGWTNLGGGYQNAVYAEMPDGTGAIFGVISAGTTTHGTIIANVPAVIRPASAHVFTCTSNGGAAVQLALAANGNIILQSPPAGLSWIAFGGGCRWPISGF